MNPAVASGPAFTDEQRALIELLQVRERAEPGEPARRATSWRVPADLRERYERLQRDSRGSISLNRIHEIAFDYLLRALGY